MAQDDGSESFLFFPYKNEWLIPSSGEESQVDWICP